jgi:enamine deaminase RidA (YjgF/YER057c/UK114 family)
MEKTFINPPELYKHPSYTRIITVKGPCTFIYLSGQTPSDENYQPIGKGDYKAQYEHIMDALTLELQAAGATWDDVISRRTYTLDVDKLRAVLHDPTTKRRENPDHPPTSTMLGVSRLSHPEFLIEIEIVAVTAA